MSDEDLIAINCKIEEDALRDIEDACHEMRINLEKALGNIHELMEELNVETR